MWPKIHHVATTGVLLTLLAVPPITRVVLAEEPAAEEPDVNPNETPVPRKPRDANLTKRHEERNKRRAEREQRRNERYRAADKARGEAGGAEE